MTKITTISIQKGGIGKSTTATNLAASLTLLGERVLLVDLDPQADATRRCGIDPQMADCETIADLFADGSLPVANVIVRRPLAASAH